MKVKPIKQRDSDACGPTCIEMVLKYFNVPHTLKKITEITNYKKEGGMYNEQIVSVLKQFGLKTKISKNTSWEKLMDLNTPNAVIIVSWMLEGYIGHVSTVERVDQKSITLAEPTTGTFMKIERVKFLRLWLDYEAQDEVPVYPESKTNIQLRWLVVVTK